MLRAACKARSDQVDRRWAGEIDRSQRREEMGLTDEKSNSIQAQRIEESQITFTSPVYKQYTLNTSVQLCCSLYIRKAMIFIAQWTDLTRFKRIFNIQGQHPLFCDFTFFWDKRISWYASAPTSSIDIVKPSMLSVGAVDIVERRRWLATLISE